MPLGRTILVPVTNPQSAAGLLRVATALVDRNGTIVPFTVLPPRASAAERDAAHELMLHAEKTVQRDGVEARGMVDVDQQVAAGVLDAALECRATLVVMGWQGRSSHQNVFGRIIDSIAGRSAVPLAVARLSSTPYRRLVLPFSDDHLASGGGMRLAAEVTRRLHAARGCHVHLLRSGAGTADLPAEVAALSEEVHRDPQRLDQAVGGTARADDLVVVPVAPTVSGLRTATTHVAWAAPDASLLVAVDVGVRPPEKDLAGAVEHAGDPGVHTPT